MANRKQSTPRVEGGNSGSEHLLSVSEFIGHRPLIDEALGGGFKTVESSRQPRKQETSGVYVLGQTLFIAS